MSGETRDVDGRPDGAVIAACSTAGDVMVIDSRTNEGYAVGSEVAFENIEVLASRQKVVVVAKDQGILAVWDLFGMSAPYPLEPAKFYD